VPLNPTSTLQEQILIHKNLLPTTLCDEIIEEYRNDSFIFGEHPTSVEQRNLHELNISSPEVINLKNSYARKLIDTKIYESLDPIRESHGEISAYQDTGYSLRKMEKGQFYTEHTDQGASIPWQLTCSIILSDQYTGGEFCFFNRALCYQLEKGDAISFPSNFMYPHEISEVTSGVRYVIVTWFY